MLEGLAFIILIVGLAVMLYLDIMSHRYTKVKYRKLEVDMNMIKTRIALLAERVGEMMEELEKKEKREAEERMKKRR